MIKPQAFAHKLLSWSRDIDRNLPWKGSKNAYHVWLSEIILQQTRVEQGLPYYTRFVARYPTISEFAAASEDDIFKLWEGLGYYSRARNMIRTAREITLHYNGNFPEDLDTLLKLPGIGPYTAAAISSFAFDKPHAVVDGNVIRVVSRILGITDPVQWPDTMSKIKNFVDVAIPVNQAAAFNQAIMDFGALHCTPKNPDCQSCDFAGYCQAKEMESVSEIPYKLKNKAKKERYFHYFLVCDPDKKFALVGKRGDSDIWKHLNEIPLIESMDSKLPDRELGQLLVGGKYSDPVFLTTCTQLLTHQKINFNFYGIIAESWPKTIGYELTDKSEIRNLAFPKTLRAFIDSYLPE